MGTTSVFLKERNDPYPIDHRLVVGLGELTLRLVNSWSANHSEPVGFLVLVPRRMCGLVTFQSSPVCIERFVAEGVEAANIQQRPDAFWLVTLSMVKSMKTGALSTWLWRRSQELQKFDCDWRHFRLLGIYLL